MEKKNLAEGMPGLDSSATGNEDTSRVLLHARMEHSYSGPLPSPSDFAAYKETLPSAPERILEMAECEQVHRHEIEKSILSKKGRENLLGQIFAFLLVLACLGVATYLSMNDHDVLAGTIITITAVLASIFYLKSYPQKKENS